MHALRKKVTRAILCDTRPPCVTEVLFDHEFWVKPGQGLRRRAVALRRCGTWRDSDWPTEDPHLARHMSSIQFRGFWSVLRQLPNRTVWVHGDSIQMQLFSAALCSLLRDGKLRLPVYARRPTWVNQLAQASGLNLFYTEAINGAKLLGSGLGSFEPKGVELVLSSVDVALFNFGLHYDSKDALRSVLGAAFSLLRRWRDGEPTHRLALWREASAQHFPGGSYIKGAEKPPPGTPCRCYPLQSRELITPTTLGHAAVEMQRTANLNVFTSLLERQLSAAEDVPLVPFFNLTAPRHDMHRAHLCAYHDQERVSACCDCTHLCYTPVFWDAVFGGLAAGVRRALRGSLPRPAAGRARALPRRRRGAGPFRAASAAPARFKSHEAEQPRHQRGKGAAGGRRRGGRGGRRGHRLPAAADYSPAGLRQALESPQARRPGAAGRGGGAGARPAWARSYRDLGRT